MATRIDFQARRQARFRTTEVNLCNALAVVVSFSQLLAADPYLAAHARELACDTASGARRVVAAADEIRVAVAELLDAPTARDRSRAGV